MILDFRQGIITYPKTGSVQHFLTYNAGYVSLSTANKQIDIAFAYGLENYLLTETVDISNAWGPITPSTNAWLYWDIDQRTGLRTFGVTYVEPTYGTTQPSSPADDQHWFNTNTKYMMVYISSTNKWAVKIRVFAAKLTTANMFVPLGSNLSAPYAGTQVGITAPSTPTGRILIDVEGKPIRRSDGAFFTTEDRIFINGSPVNAIRFDAMILDAEAISPTATYQITKYTEFGKINLATYNDTQTTIIAITLESIDTHHTGAICIQGAVTNPLWNWTTVGAPLWIHGTIPGYFTEIDPHVVDVISFPEAKPPVARVITPTTIYFDQGLGGYGGTGGGTVSGNYVAIDGDVMTGPLTLYNDPTENLHAATKQYVDNLSLDNLSDVTITGPTSNQTLQFNGTQWVNVPDNLDSLTDVTITGPTSNQTLQFNGTQWVNATSNLDNLSDVTITGPTLNQLLQFNGTQWVNATVDLEIPPGYKQLFIATEGQTTFGPLGNPYVVGGGQLSVYLNGIMQYPSTINETSTTTFALTSPAAAGEEILAVISQITPPYIYPVPSILNDLADVIIDTPQVNHAVVYNGSHWVNQLVNVGSGDDIVSVFRVGVPGGEANHSHLIAMTKADAESLITLAVPFVDITSTTQNGHNHIVSIGYDPLTYSWYIDSISNNTLDNHFCLEISSNINTMTGVSVSNQQVDQILACKPITGGPLPLVWQNITPWWNSEAATITVGEPPPP